MANIRKLIFLFFEVFFIFYLIFKMLFRKTKLTNFINSTRFFTQPIQQLIYREHGNPAEVLTLSNKELEFDKLERQQVLVKWLAAPINPADINQVQGAESSSSRGSEGCAQVIKVGSDVAEFKENDLIVPAISGIGTWCSHGIYDSKELFLVEGDVKDFIFLSMLQTNPSTAYRMLKDFVNLSYGDIVVQNGANSSVGHFVIQICRILGVKTVNVVRDRPQIEILKNQLKKSGADEVYTEEEFSTLIRSNKLKAKLALNCVGGKSGMILSRALELGGTMVTYGGMSQNPSVGFWMSRWYGMRQNIEERKNMYKELIGWYKNGELTLPKYQRKNLEEYKDAINQSTQSDSSSIKSKQIFTKKGNDHYFD
uniref:Enoyl-[acyl-carrier-protein] reductase, mitochondrial n=1 Tax=Meloidogyne enterolobii TaxID=390850 RepID=A0A6V7U379_MELEN|nr:unnamed protein product [Meloidogyne enterolobii]